MKSAPDQGRPDGRGGRPTKAAAAERDERLLEIAAQMFMRDGFDGTSMERLAEAARIGKATLYARYADKSQPSRRRPAPAHPFDPGPLEAEFAEGHGGEALSRRFSFFAAISRPLPGVFGDRAGAHSGC